MKLRFSSSFVLRPVVCLVVILLTASNIACAADKTDGTEAQASNAEKNQALEQLTNKVKQSLAAYKANPDPVQWDACWKDFIRLVEEATAKSVDLPQALKSIPGLSEYGFRMTDSPPLRIFSFTRVPESQQILIAWKDSVVEKTKVLNPKVKKPAGKKLAGKKGKQSSSVKTVLKYGASHFQLLSCPASVYVNDARLISGTSGENPPQAGSPARASHAAAGKYLVLCGADKKSGLAWLAGYRLFGGSWVKCPELFSGVPPYLLENVQGRTSFSGPNLVFSSEPLKAAGGSYQTDASGYKLVLRFLGDHFALDTKSSTDTTMTIAMQFSQAIQQGRADLVRAWLVDSKLASIPAYLGLYKRPSGAPPFKLIAMAAPLNGGSRYRLITYDKNDLILDIGKIKAQWAIKGIFIAPADPVAKRLMGLSQPDNKVLDSSEEQKKSKIEGGAN